MDFNPTFFAHPMAADGFTLAHPDEASAGSGSSTASPAAGSARRSARRWARRASRTSGFPTARRTRPIDRKGPAQRLAARSTRLRRADRPAFNRDAVEGKLFGIGSESYVVGSHEFYLGYAVTRKKLLCLDAGHFHPTEVVSDKISAVLCTSTRSCCTSAGACAGTATTW